MTDPTPEQVSAFRARLGVGIQDAKRALREFKGDEERAAWFLRNYGLAVWTRVKLRWPSEATPEERAYWRLPEP